ncbi:hypothetical protein IB229_14120 [Pseudomonas sp. PDM14]|uniref:hypothetical protein n=1 Tax=Pseudomonas sp. PDM14 TaxID=2769288 RepID=UPI00178441C4|nr:hypothetical protein [Pseudomonas sp. PDM14]MBD9484116.1 hypothetical protein [Pseudomonas sp. PDM14]
MDGKYLLLLSCVLASPGVFAEACHVHSQSSSAQVSTVATESCYEYRGMPVGAIDWSCSNESKEMLASEKSNVANCKAGYFGQCTAKLTQEALANHSSTSENQGENSVAVPDDAQVITYYYTATDRPQTKIDCENGGGKWSDK